MATKTTTTKTTANTCKCGCGQTTPSTYRPGHDAKHVSVLISYIEANTHSIEQAKAELPSVALQVKLHNALARRNRRKATKVKNPCVVCGINPRTKNTLGQNPELCDTCWEEAGWENEHYDGGHEPGSMPKQCPLCR